MSSNGAASQADDPLGVLLSRSTDLQDRLIQALRVDDTFDLSAPVYGLKTAVLAAELSLEHGSGLRMLMATGHPRSATATMRMQYEAMVRSAWAFWAASPEEIDLLEQELSTESEFAARRVGEYGAMKRALQVSSCPEVLKEQLATFDEISWRSLNSFVHGGIHALRRGEDGFPLWLALQVVKTSNGLVTMAVAMLSKLSGDDRGLSEINRVLPTFEDCLPDLIPRKPT